jgi:hypothetical protein
VTGRNTNGGGVPGPAIDRVFARLLMTRLYARSIISEYKIVSGHRDANPDISSSRGFGIERCLPRRVCPWWSIFGPDEPYERSGDVGNVTFPCGYTIGADRGSRRIYDGAANTSIALATANVAGMLRWLDEDAASRIER